MEVTFFASDRAKAADARKFLLRLEAWSSWNLLRRPSNTPCSRVPPGARGGDLVFGLGDIFFARQGRQGRLPRVFGSATKTVLVLLHPNFGQGVPFNWITKTPHLIIFGQGVPFNFARLLDLVRLIWFSGLAFAAMGLLS